MTGSDGRALVFVGPMGSGKTSIGRRVARQLGLPFADTDKLIAAEHGPIPGIFAEHGEDRFRAIERDVVRAALASGGVVALGGGAVLDAGTRDDLGAHRVVLLTVDARTVSRRIRDGNRPLVAGANPVESWSRIAQERRPLYEEVADVVFDTSRGPLQGVVDAVVAWAIDKDKERP
ncbi:MAG: shikimate kinase [Microbacterium sp.]|uniref:shikimate kinase n=1 Tax=Microbacterium sp. TaxID=51671 RepID=UPI0039E2DF5A